ncbi:hypothetical protein IJM86_09105 [bacterium]|nr:hypothetical protein [bacterium]
MNFAQLEDKISLLTQKVEALGQVDMVGSQEIAELRKEIAELQKLKLQQ